MGGSVILVLINFTLVLIIVPCCFYLQKDIKVQPSNPQRLLSSGEGSHPEVVNQRPGAEVRVEGSRGGEETPVL